MGVASESEKNSSGAVIAGLLWAVCRDGDGRRCGARACAERVRQMTRRRLALRRWAEVACRPEMLRCVAAPGTPLFTACEQLRGRERLAEEMLRVAKDADVGGGKGVGMMQAAERDVLRGPLADAGNGAQAGDAFLQRVGGFKEIGLGDGGTRKRLRVRRGARRACRAC